MKLLNTRSNYGLISWAFHWIIVLAIVIQWLLAEAEEDFALFNTSGFGAEMLHRSIGLTILLLASVRLAWKFFNPKPDWPADMKPHEIKLASAVHFGLYALVFALPLTGWALASVEEAPLRFFDWFNVPRIAVAREESLEDVHEALFNILVGFAVLHIVGAAKHWLLGNARGRDIAKG